MYYVVPQGRSIISSVAKAETMFEAKKYADKQKSETGDNFDIIRMDRVYTTQTIDEAMLAAQDAQ